MANKTADINAYMREYRVKNKEKLAEKIVCEVCNITYTITNLGHHRKSERHKYFLEWNKKQQEEENRYALLQKEYCELREEYNKLRETLEQN